MEIAQLCKSACNNQLQQSIYLCHKRKKSQIGEHTFAEPKLKLHHDAHLHPLTYVPTKCELSAPYGIQEIAKILKPMVTMTRSKDISGSHQIEIDKILKPTVTLTRSKDKSGSHHDVAYLQPLTNGPTNYQLSTPYDFRDIAQTIFYSSKSQQQGQRSNQGHTMTLLTYTPQPMPLPKYQLPKPYSF